jgi:prepilin-type N-terminal cleavage/methylation domain-containing protein
MAMDIIRINTEKGFTMVELVLVMVVMSILAFTAVPKDPGSQLMNLDAAARRIEGDLRYAQNLSMTTGDGYGVHFTGPTTYEVYLTTDGSVVSSPYDHQPMQMDLNNDYPGVSVSAADQAEDIVFNSYGEPVAGGGDTVQLNSGTSNKVISISLSSGFVSID